MKKILLILLFTSLICISFVNIALAKSGCCSWHDGVSHCDTSTGRQVCNDGTYSPSCTCQYIPPQPAYTPPAETYTWNGQDYTDHSQYENIKRSDITTLYKSILERNPISEEVNAYFDSGKDYPVIKQEFYDSDEYKQLQDKKKQITASPAITTQAYTPTNDTTSEPISENDGSTDWLYVLLPVGIVSGIGYAVYKNKNKT